MPEVRVGSPFMVEHSMMRALPGPIHALGCCPWRIVAGTLTHRSSLSHLRPHPT